MDKKIVEFLKKYDISDNEIKDIITIAPMMDVVKYCELVENCIVLTKFGYPKSELDFLLLSNPNIFVKSSFDLEKELMSLKKQYGDIEIILKNNPTII